MGGREYPAPESPALVGHPKRAACLFFTTWFTLPGMAATVDAGHGAWPGTIGGGLVGLYFGLILDGGMKGGRLLDVIYPTTDNDDRPDINSLC